MNRKSISVAISNSTNLKERALWLSGSVSKGEPDQGQSEPDPGQ
jgi:hypothetical protein